MESLRPLSKAAWWCHVKEYRAVIENVPGLSRREGEGGKGSVEQRSRSQPTPFPHIHVPSLHQSSQRGVALCFVVVLAAG